MIPTSTRATVQLVRSMPAASEATAVFIHKETKSAAAYASLPEPLHNALNCLLSSGVVRGKSNEVTVQWIEGAKPSRLIVVGLGSEKKFSAECLREAGAAMAKAALKGR